MSETGTKIKTLLKRSDISSIIYGEKYRGLKRSGLYVLTAQGYFRNCNTLKILDNELTVTVSTSNASLIETSIKKSDMCGLFFTDYTKIKESDPNKQSLYVGFRKTNMNFSFAYAMLLASLASDSPELDKYYKDLRSGFAIATNFSIYTSDKFGTGPFVKSFLTSNSASSLNFSTSAGVIYQTSDRINCMLFAWNLVFRQRFNNYLNNEFNLAPGYFYYHNNTSVNSDHFAITGHGFGLNLSNRINFTNEDQGVFIDLSVFLGAMKKYRIEGFKFESEKTDNYSRVEIGIGLKF